MNRRALVRSFFIAAPAAAAVALPVTAQLAEPGLYAMAQISTCLKCGGHVMVANLRFPDARRVIQCGSPECENHWPWIQEGVIQKRVPADIVELMDRKESVDAQARTYWYSKEPGAESKLVALNAVSMRCHEDIIKRLA